MNERNQSLDGLMDYIEKGVSPFHTVQRAAEDFAMAG